MQIDILSKIKKVYILTILINQSINRVNNKTQMSKIRVKRANNRAKKLKYIDLFFNLIRFKRKKIFKKYI